MKKFIISILPPCLVLLILMWFYFGLIETLAYLSAVLFCLLVGTLFVKWAEFVDKHFKD